MITITCTRIVKVHKINQLFVTVHTRFQWVKPVQPAEPIFLTPTLLMGAAERRRLINILNRDSVSLSVFLSAGLAVLTLLQLLDV